MLYGVGFSRRTYAEPARFVIFAIGLEVELDRQRRWFAAEILPNLGGLERLALGLDGGAGYGVRCRLASRHTPRAPKVRLRTGSKTVWLLAFLDSPVDHDDPANDRN